MKKDKTNSPVINFVGYRIDKINYEIASKNTDNRRTNISAKYKIFREKNLAEATLISKFRNERHSKDGSVSRDCEIQITGSFKLKPQTTIEDAKEYIAINGSSMLYPYLRTISSLIVALDAPENVILPSINFLDAYKNLKPESDLDNND